VVPLHSYKFLATLQHVLAGYPGSPQRNPLILRVDVNAGHGGGARAPVPACSALAAPCLKGLSHKVVVGPAAVFRC